MSSIYVVETVPPFLFGSAWKNPMQTGVPLWHPEKTPPGWGWWWSTRVSGGRWGVENRRKDGWKEQKQWKLVYIIPQDFGNQKVVLAAGSSVINWCGVFWGHPISQNWPPRFRLLRSSGMPESARGCHLSHVVCQVGYQSKFWEILTSIFICLLLFIQDFYGFLRFAGMFSSHPFIPVNACMHCCGSGDWRAQSARRFRSRAGDAGKLLNISWLVQNGYSMK